MKKFAVIVAGGAGQRMRSAVPKQFLLLHNKPIICHSIEAFQKAFDAIDIIIVLPKDYRILGEEMVTKYEYKNVTLAEGGETRFHSVQNGLKQISENSIVFVHDAVRCLVTPTLIEKCYQQAIEKGSAIPAVAATDSIRIANESGHHVIDRNAVRIIQTPQVFKSELLLKAFQQPFDPAFTDEATVVESMGETVHLIEGEHDNIKITRPVDIILAEQILKSRLAL